MDKATLFAQEIDKIRNDTLYGTATSFAKLFEHGQHIYAIAKSSSQLALAPKKITTPKKWCNPIGIEIGYSPIQHLQIQPYNSYYYCEEICIRIGESLAKCYH